MIRGFLLLGCFLVQFLLFPFAFADYSMAYDYLMELGRDSFDCGDYDEAFHYFERARLARPDREEPAGYIGLIERMRKKEEAPAGRDKDKVITSADLYRWERGLEQRLDESLARQREITGALRERMETLFKQNQDAVYHAFRLETGKQALLDEISGLEVEIKELAGQIKDNIASAGELSVLKEINSGLREEVFSLGREVEELESSREQDREDFRGLLKEEISSLRGRYTRRLKDVQSRLEKVDFEREQLYKQMEQMAAKIEEKSLKLSNDRGRREAEEKTLDKYDDKAGK